MMEQGKMTVDRVIEITIGLLGDIPVPVSMENISAPIKGAMRNLRICLDAIRAQAQEEAKAPEEAKEDADDERDADAE